MLVELRHLSRGDMKIGSLPRAKSSLSDRGHVLRTIRSDGSYVMNGVIRLVAPLEFCLVLGGTVHVPVPGISFERVCILTPTGDVGWLGDCFLEEDV